MLSKQANRLINARNWAVLVKPEQIVRENDPADTMYGKFVCEPLERGYGTTIGNALRRVLLASLQGAAFVSVKIAGVQHEFTTIPGVLEDVTDIILNIKQVRLAMDTDAPQTVTLNVNKKGEVTAGDILGNQRQLQLAAALIRAQRSHLLLARPRHPETRRRPRPLHSPTSPAPPPLPLGEKTARLTLLHENYHI